MIDNLVALVGKQPMPILIPILQFKPKKSWLIVTKETEEHAKNIRDTIKLCNKQVIALPLTCRPVSPYIPEEVEQEIGKIYQQPESNTYINITGGTSMMSLGAYNAARKYSLPMIYVNTDENQIVFLTPDGREKNKNVDIDLNLSVKEYLLAHGATYSQEKPWGKAIIKNEPWINPFIEVANRIGSTYSQSAPLMDAIREAYQKRGKSQEESTGIISNPSSKTIDLTYYLLEKGFISHCCKIENDLKVNIHDQVDEQTERIRKFLEGIWLEIFVYKTLCESKRFDDIRMEVSIKRKISSGTEKTVKNEIDVVAMLNSRIAAISCKTERILSGERDKRGEAKEALYELDSLLQADLMGLYAKKILVSNQESFSDSLRDRADLSKIKLLNGTQLPDLVKKIKNALRNY